MQLEKLYKRTSTGSIQEWEMEIADNKYRTITGKQDGKKIVNAWVTCIGKTNETSPETQAINEATAKWRKQQEKGHYHTNIDNIDDETYFKVMLAKSYDDRKDKLVFDSPQLLVSPKLDGIRFVGRKDIAHSRNGKPLGGATDLKKQLDKLFEEYPDLITDGELYNHKYKDDFNSIVSMIKRDENKITDKKREEISKYLEYHIYDIPRFNGMTEDTPYIERFEGFWTVINDKYPELLSIIKKVPYAPANSHEDITSAFKKYVAEGYEGAIIRFNGKYEGKRTWNLLKVKEFIDEEFEIVEVLEGRGKKENTAGSLTMRMKDGRTFNSNIKGGYKFYDKLWKSKDRLIGKTATIQFFEYTEYGIPRFPYCIKVAREDYE
jgi:DNA ligase-1